MSKTFKELSDKIAETEKQMQVWKNNLNAVGGAIQQVDKFIKQDDNFDQIIKNGEMPADQPLPKKVKIKEKEKSGTIIKRGRKMKENLNDFLEDLANNTPNADQFDHLDEKLKESDVKDVEQDLMGGKSFKALRKEKKEKNEDI